MESPAEHVQRVGRTLNDKWTLHALLGVGGAGAVYAATHRNGRAAAVKILHRELTTDPEQVSRFLREGYIANQLAHPGVVAVIDDDVTEDGLVYLVIERLEGRSLDEELTHRGGSIPPWEALAIADAVLDVLAAAHAKGIVHRDVKPENVFLLAGGGIKVLDFGIAKARNAPAGVKATQVGAVFGTPGFMPPEQARGRSELVDARTDVWAAGATLYVMVTGKKLHDAGTTNESLLRAMVEAVPPVQTALPSLPGEVASILDKALAFEPSARWQDAQSMQAALRQAWATLYASRDSWQHASSRQGVTPAFLPVEVHTPRFSAPLSSWPVALRGSQAVRLTVLALVTATIGAAIGLVVLSSRSAPSRAAGSVIGVTSPVDFERTDADPPLALASAPSPSPSAVPVPATSHGAPPAHPAPPRVRREDALRDRH
jgi:serine/threonine protein kinase